MGVTQSFVSVFVHERRLLFNNNNSVREIINNAARRTYSGVIKKGKRPLRSLKLKQMAG